MRKSPPPRSPEHRAKIAAALRGVPKSTAHRAALAKSKSEAHRAALSAANLNPDIQERRRQTMLARYGVAHPKHIPGKNNLTLEYWLSRGLSRSQAQLQLSEIQSRACAQRGTVVSHWSKDYWTARGLSEAEAAAKVSELQSANAAKSTFTVSREASSFLDGLEELSGRAIARETTLLGRFKVDGLLREFKLVIEYFGSFWHMHPTLFAPEDRHRVTGWRAAAKWAEDAGRVKALERSGYLVWVVWDFEAPDLLRPMGRSIKTAAIVECDERAYDREPASTGSAEV
jgi:G:T-mismatch repair DNA endonuclease (very short patch repair protein)